MRAPLFLISLALSSAACSPAGDEADLQASDGGEGANAAAKATAPAGEQESGAQGVDFEDSKEDRGGVRNFRYRWPSQVSEIEALARQLASERDEALAEQKREWQSSLLSSPPDCVTCRGRNYEKEWQVVADIPGWLSLSANLSVYTGGAHGTYGKSSLVWDRKAQEAVEGIAMFTSPVALENALGAKLCDALDRAREARRGVPVSRDGAGGFNDCPGLDEATVLIGSSTGEYFDRISVYFGPYVAGPYAEGDYELNFPVTASVLDAVRPRYAGAFRVKR